MNPKEPKLPKDSTKLLLDRIIGWEKDISEYGSLEGILREQFIIYERREGADFVNTLLNDFSESQKECFSSAAAICPHHYGDEGGNSRCSEIDRLREALGKIKSWTLRFSGDHEVRDIVESALNN